MVDGRVELNTLPVAVKHLYEDINEEALETDPHRMMFDVAYQ